jgi:uncharacterized protein with HEPN domain
MRSNRTAAVYYDDILTAITRLETYCAERTLDEFLGDVQLQDSVLYRLLTLTEAAHRLQPEEEMLCPGQNWRKIRDLGNVLRHDYDRLDLTRIWNVVQNDLPSLKQAAEMTMNKYFPDVPRT